MPRSRLLGYALAVASVAAAFVLQLAIRAITEDRQPFVTFYLAIMVSAWWGGLRPSLLALVLGFFAGTYFITFGDAPIRIDTGEAVLAAAYLLFAPLIAFFIDAMRSAERRAIIARAAADESAVAARESAAAARESANRIRRLTDSSIIGIVFWDDQGGISDANGAFLAMVRHSEDALAQGRLRWIDLVAPDYLPRHYAVLEQIRLRGECDAFESVLVRSDGERVPILCGAVSFDEQGTEGVTFLLDMTESARVRRELEEEEARYRTLFEDSPVILVEEDWSALKRRVDELRSRYGDLRGYFTAHPDEVWACFRLIRIVRVNRVGRELLVMPTMQDVPSDLAMVVTEESRDRIARLLVAVAKGRHQLRGEDTFFTMAGAQRDMLFEISVLPGHEQSFDAVLCSLVDVTEERKVQADRARLLSLAEQARAEAEAASRAKDQFLAMLGHELRNPFAAVANAVATARLDASRRTRALEIAERQCDQLGRLIDDLLDVARITQSRINLRKESVSLAAIVRRAIEATEDAIEERGHHLELSAPPEEIIVEVDPARLEQVVVNLLTNAAKYTDPGGRIHVTVTREGVEGVVCVRDTGIGIAPDVLAHVFELFAQGERALDRAQGGLGIGLTLVRRIVELHGGRVEARSDGVGKGAEFEVRFPAVAAIESQPGIARDAGANERSARVLVIDDNPDAAESLLMLLEVLGHSVRVFHDGPSGLEAAGANPPDVMIVDIGLPGIDGYEVARRVRKDPALAGVKLVALTGYGLDEDKRRSMEAGFDYHLVKPVDLNTLKGLVPRLAIERPKSTLLH